MSIERQTFAVRFEPWGIEVQVEPGRTLLEAARAAELPLAAVCGGRGACGKCQVRIRSGEASSMTRLERETLPATLHEQGTRLACQCSVIGPVTVEALTVHSHGKEEAPRLDRPPALSSTDRRMSPTASGRPPLGLAVDLGTTNLAAYLYRLDNPSLAGVYSAADPLAAYGADIVTRLVFGESAEGNAARMQRVLVKAVNLLAAQAARDQGGTPEDIQEMVAVGNTGMHHLFLGLPVRQLIRAPFLPARKDGFSVTASQLGISMAPDGSLFLPPLLDGFIGSDLLSVALVTRMDQKPGIRLAVDIGTNSELLLSVRGELHTCSTASGPALEGAALRQGGVAALGMIDGVWVDEPGGQLAFHTIGGRPAKGICGSGIIDAIACLRRLGAIDRTGRLQAGSPLVRQRPDGNHLCVLAGPEQTAFGQDLTVSQTEIRAIQLAKGAIRAGIDTLCAANGVRPGEIDEVLVAGAFGSRMRMESALEIGLFPEETRGRIRQIGNAAGLGAGLILLFEAERSAAMQLSRSIHYMELSNQKGFLRSFALAQWFPMEKE